MAKDKKVSLIVHGISSRTRSKFKAWCAAHNTTIKDKIQELMERTAKTK